MPDHLPLLPARRAQKTLVHARGPCRLDPYVEGLLSLLTREKLRWYRKVRFAPGRLAKARSSVGERLPDTQEVGGSIPPVPTILIARPGFVRHRVGVHGCLSFFTERGGERGDFAPMAKLDDRTEPCAAGRYPGDSSPGRARRMALPRVFCAIRSGVGLP